eukprot:CAMPEP_0171104330 /NCGR_PEP_ID=MMETSP0766_2-20121228/60436_1 /TAXON_ID=439317 /ORGANISM="Gambierdiscus australes, Strain CAWD 149" /LENGTH=196 /DNA_ID=CAMNT_0011564939 /DNA_START=66 /DNA_END=656 /DNA_ORIENTATION=+
MSPVLWATVAMGTCLGLSNTLLSGAAKIFPCHPQSKAMEYGFNNVYAPFLGFSSGTPLRICVGLGEFCAGVTLLVGLWGEGLQLWSGGLSDASKAAVIVSGVALWIVSGVAALMHEYLDGAMGPPSCLAVLAMVFTVVRMFWFGPVTVAMQVLCTLLSMVIMLGALVVIIINKEHGQHQSAVEQENKQLQKMLDGK